jgi:glutathione synthase/RimK-type ligase-like ATP-grasp enzyme
MILVISRPNDEHALAVMSELECRRVKVKLLDLADFPQNLRLSIHYTNINDPEYLVKFPDGEQLSLEALRSIWWRRPQQFVIDPEITQAPHRDFALNESHEAFAGLWRSVQTLWINDPKQDDAAHRKVYQLRIAQEVGLRIPQTLITNDPLDANAFVAARDPEPTVYKAFSATAQNWRETRLLKAAELDLLDNVKYAPVIFQEYIPAQYDLRITIIGQEIFPAAIFSQETSYQVDYRMDMGKARVEPVDLPDEVRSQLLSLMSRLGLVYGAIDMRLMPTGEYVFLEINPAGQWLFIESATQQKITGCMVDALIKGRS